ARRQRGPAQALVVLVGLRLEPTHVPAGRYLPAELVVAEVERGQLLQLRQRRRHAAVDPVAAHVEEQQVLWHLHAG
uniref:Uncharacterized protein n=1 Tax=Triticum urartu TaxID=4572 RepID=A0A8R7TJV1_TRIUA